MYYLVKYRNAVMNPNAYDIILAKPHKNEIVKWLRSKYPSFENYNDKRRTEQKNKIMNGELYRIKHD